MLLQQNLNCASKDFLSFFIDPIAHKSIVPSKCFKEAIQIYLLFSLLDVIDTDNTDTIHQSIKVPIKGIGY
jgi:hypothetical protein